jgi:hypothetical protein
VAVKSIEISVFGLDNSHVAAWSRGLADRNGSAACEVTTALAIERVADQRAPEIPLATQWKDIGLMDAPRMATQFFQKADWNGEPHKLRRIPPDDARSKAGYGKMELQFRVLLNSQSELKSLYYP